MTTPKKPRVRKTTCKTKDTETEQQEDVAAEEDEHEIGLHVSLVGPLKEEDGDYLHPQDLARYELFRVKKELAQAKKVIVEKEEAILRMTLKWQEQSLRIAKLEHDSKTRDITELKRDLDKTILGAKSELNSLGLEFKEKYKLDPEDLIYDDESGKIMFMDED